MITVKGLSYAGTPLELLRECGGFYSCPKDADGKRRGPLVGYAGRDELGRQYVGDVYANFAMAERHGPVLRLFASQIYRRLETFDYAHLLRRSIGFCGAPEGGKALAVALSYVADSQYIFPEKKVTALATADSRERSRLVFDRHEPHRDDFWWIVEDVCNNFSTTKDLVALIESFGASVCGVVCFLNRSTTVGNSFSPYSGLDLPVISIVQQQIAQYRQDDPAVADDIKAGNIVWKPKNEWDRLAAAMAV